MPPNYFASTIRPLSVTLALVTLTLICQSLEAQAAELMASPDHAVQQQSQSSTPPTSPSVTVVVPAAKPAAPAVQAPSQPSAEQSKDPLPSLPTAANPFQFPDSFPTDPEALFEDTPPTALVESSKVEVSTVDTPQSAAFTSKTALSNQEWEDLLNDFCNTTPTAPFQDITPSIADAIDTANQQEQPHLTAEPPQQVSAAITQRNGDCGSTQARAIPVSPTRQKQDNQEQEAPKQSPDARSETFAPRVAPSTPATQTNALVSQLPADISADIPPNGLRDVQPQIIPRDPIPPAASPLPQSPSPPLPPSTDLLHPSEPPAIAAIEDNNVFDAQLLEDLLNAFCDADADADELQDTAPSFTDLADPDCSTTHSFTLQSTDTLFDASQSSLNLVNRSIDLTSPFPKTVSTSAPFSSVLVAQASPNLSQDFPRDIPQDLPRNILPQIIPRDPIPPETAPPPTEPPAPLPSPDQLLQPTEPPSGEPEVSPREAAQTVFVEQFTIEGSTVFDADELATLAWRATALNSDAAIPDLIRSYCPDSRTDASDASAVSPEASQNTQNVEAPADATGDRSPPQETTDTDAASTPIPPNGRELSFEQLLRARSAITQLYIKCGYITSGAILPPQTPEDQNNTVIIQVVEGSLEDIEVTGLRRLNSSYVRSRLAIAGSEPLNRERLLRGLQLLQLDPLIRRISADLQAGTRPATSILRVEAIEADSFDVSLNLNNNRSPSVGTFQRGLTFDQANLLGFGDGLSVSYNNTDGSNGIEGSYSIPVNPRNGTIGLRGGYTHSHVIEDPFDVLDIEAESSYYEVTFRQPIFQIPTEEFALGLTFSRQESQTELGIDDIGPFPLSPGADEEGRTRISALRFTQDWLNRTPKQVLAARSQFSLGLDLFNATVNEAPLPDGRFFAWRGQVQWVRLLDDRGTLLLARADAQLTGDSLVPLEQFGLGGQDTIRGYRQDALLTDSGVYGSVEVRFPVVRVRDWQAILYLVPFLDAGTGWDAESSTDPEETTLVGTGIGLLWEMDDYLTARVDWGLPLISIDSRERTWQESGVYFSIQYSPF